MCPQSRTLRHSGFSSASCARSSGLLLLKHLQHILRLPAALRSVRSLRGFAPCLQIQRTNTVSQSHESRLHGGLETFRTTLCPVCLQTPERMKQLSVNGFIYVENKDHQEHLRNKSTEFLIICVVSQCVKNNERRQHTALEYPLEMEDVGTG